MKRILNTVDLHIVSAGLMIAVCSIVSAARVLVGSEIPSPVVLVVLLGAFELVLQPMLLTRGFDRPRSGNRSSYIAVNETLIVAMALVSFVGVQMVT